MRKSYRADGNVRKRTTANLTHWPEQLVEGLRTLLRGGVALGQAADALIITRSLPHGHVAAGLGTADGSAWPSCSVSVAAARSSARLVMLSNVYRGEPADYRFGLDFVVPAVGAPADGLPAVRNGRIRLATPGMYDPTRNDIFSSQIV